MFKAVACASAPNAVELTPVALAPAPIAVELTCVDCAPAPTAVEVDVDASDPLPIATASLSKVVASPKAEPAPKPVITPLPMVMPGCPPVPSALPKFKSPPAAETPRVAAKLVAVTLPPTFTSPTTPRLFLKMESPVTSVPPAVTFTVPANSESQFGKPLTSASCADNASVVSRLSVSITSWATFNPTATACAVIPTTTALVTIAVPAAIPSATNPAASATALA